MKKILFIITFLLVVIMPTKVLADDDITVYVFRGYDCGHCENMLNYMYNHKNEINKNVKVVTYEVKKVADNSKLMDKVADMLNVDKENNYGTPFTVIGDKYIKGFVGATTFNEINKIANEYLNNGNYKDVVKETINNEGYRIKETSLEDIYGGPSKTVVIVVYSIFGVAILGMLAMMFLGRRK